MRWLALTFTVALLTGCDDQVALPTAPSPTPAVEVANELPARERRRLDLDQLDAALVRTTGTIWQVDGVPQLVAMSTTLGKPDYADRTTEDLAVSPIFTKILDEAARSVCGELMAAERTRVEGARLFFTHIPPDTDDRGDPLDRQLARLVLRFHGRTVDASTAAMWRTLYTNVASVHGPAVAWDAVCIALITHPDFYTY